MDFPLFANQQPDDSIFAKVKKTLHSEQLSEEIRHILLALLVDLQETYIHIQTGRDQWLSALDAMNDPVFLIDSKFQVVRANIDYARHADMDVRDVIGRPYWQVFPLLDGPSESCLKGMRDHNEGIEELALPSGQVFLDHFYTVFDNDDRILFSLHVLEDITERKQLDAVLQESEELFRSMATLAQDAIMVLDDEGRIAFWNQAAEIMFGYSRQEAEGRLMHELIVPERLRDDHLHGYKTFAATGQGPMVGQTIQLPAVRKDGSEFSAEHSIAAITRNGQWHTIGIVRNISKRTRQQQQIQLFRNLLDYSNDAIEVIDPTTVRFLDVNDTACRELGYSRNELLAMSVPDIDPNFGSADMKGVEEQIKTSGFAIFDTLHQRKDGSTFPVEVSLRIIELEQTYFLSIARDISARQQAEQRLQNINRALHTLRRVNQALVRSTEESALNKEVCRILTEVGDYCFAWIGYPEHDKDKRVRPVAWSGKDAGYLDEITISWSDNQYGRGPTGTVIRSGSPVVINDIATHPYFAPWREQAGKRNYLSSMALPLLDGSGCFGALNIYSAEASAFDDESQSLLLEMASDLAFGITTLRHRLRAAEREKQMRVLIEYNPDAILILDEVGNVEFANPTAEILMGQPASQLKGAPLGLPMSTGETTEIEILSHCDDGTITPRNVELRLVDIAFADKPATLAFLHDYTSRKKAEQLATRMGRILEHSWNEIYAFTVDTLRFVDVSTGALQHLGYTLGELQQMTPMELMPTEFGREQFEALLAPLRDMEKYEIQFESEQRCRDGTCYPVEVRLQLSHEEYPPVFIAIVQDISERKRYIAELEHKALYDVLTELPNRALLHDRLDHSLKMVHRETTSLAVLTMTIRRMSEINDLIGYQYGDCVLKEVSHRLLGVCRDSDTVARLGDNEFVLILEGATLESAQQAAGKIHQILELPIIIEELSLEVEAAIGIAMYPEHGEDTKTLLQHGDIAMRTAKYESLGIAVYSHEDVPYSLKQLKLHGELRQAIQNNEMAVYYQPKVDIKTSSIMGVEALARWPHPQEGMIPPNDFIPMIEQSGLIRPFTLWVLETAIIQLHDWRAEGIDLSIAVNLSTRNLLDPELPTTIIKLLKKHQVSAHNLCLEITESALMSRPEQALHVLNQLHDIGARLSIDDFGTGYSSLAYLKKLPVDEIKIDQSFIFGLTENEDDAVIVHSTIDLAHHLGLKTVAEGVETKEIIGMLKILQCDIAQGYYMSRPLPTQELRQWLHNSPWGISPPM